MAYRINARLGSGAHTLATLIGFLNGRKDQGIVEVGFNILPGPARDVGVGEAQTLTAREKDAAVRSTVPPSCASVIFVSPEAGTALVHHIAAGTLSQPSIRAALVAIGAAPASVLAVYAHPRPDSGGDSDIRVLESWGVKSTNIVEIANLPLPSFGINGDFQLGY